VVDSLIVERVFLFVFCMWMEENLSLVVPLVLLLEQRGLGVVARISLVVVGVVEPIYCCSIIGWRRCDVSGWQCCRIVWWVPRGALCK
jgi:hypothetical protein